jgi:hypothetical protein
MDDEESSAQLQLMFRYIQMIDYHQSDRSRQGSALPFLLLGPNWRTQDHTANPAQRFNCLLHAYELKCLYERFKNGAFDEAVSIEMVELCYGCSVVEACRWTGRSVPGRKRDQLERAFQGGPRISQKSSSLCIDALEEVPESQWASPEMSIALNSPTPPRNLDEPLVKSLLAVCLLACQQVARAQKVGPGNREASSGAPASAELKIGYNGWVRSDYYGGRLWGLLRTEKHKAAFADLSPSARPIGKFTATQWTKRVFEIARIHRPHIALDVVHLVWEVYRPVGVPLSWRRKADALHPVLDHDEPRA